MKRITTLLLILLIGCCWYFAGGTADAQDNFSVEPTTNNGEKWKLAYYEGGPYRNYPITLTAIVNGLMDLGWLEPKEIPTFDNNDTKALWDWFATEVKSDYIEFVQDAHYSTGWDRSEENNLRDVYTNELITRGQNGEIDLIIAMGTWAGKDLANDRHTIPTIVCSTSDPLSAGIIKSVEDSGYEQIHARVDPYRYERQVMIFHDIIMFQKLGLAYKDTTSGRTYAALEEVERVAAERGFEIIHCHVKITEDRDEEVESVKACFHELGKTADAIYVTEQTGVNSESVPELVQIANSYKIPTFSQSGSDYVKDGFLLSIAQAGFKYVGMFHAETIAKVFNGATPRELGQIFEDPPKIAINLKTAEIIGYEAPVDVLGAADEIYQDIRLPGEEPQR